MKAGTDCVVVIVNVCVKVSVCTSVSFQLFSTPKVTSPSGMNFGKPILSPALTADEVSEVMVFVVVRVKVNETVKVAGELPLLMMNVVLLI